MIHFYKLFILFLLIAMGAIGQTLQIMAPKVNVGDIRLDGKLDEPIWNHPDLQIDSVIPGPATIDTFMKGPTDVSGPADRSARFAIVWTDSGLYCASWNRDDIHSVVHCADTNNYADSWKDDGNEWWFDYDFSDIWDDNSFHYFGNNGWQFLKPFKWNGAESQDNHVGVNSLPNSGPATTMTINLQVARERGFDAPCYSTDGINYQSEVFIRWSNAFWGQKPVPSPGKELAFNLGVNDNDDGGSGNVFLRWTGHDHHNYRGWGKVVLLGNELSSSGIALSKTKLVFSDTVGKGDPAIQTVIVSAFGGASVSNLWASGKRNWLNVMVLGTDTTRTLENSISIAGLAYGTYRDTVEVNTDWHKETYAVELVLDTLVPVVSVRPIRKGEKPDVSFFAGSQGQIAWNVYVPGNEPFDLSVYDLSGRKLGEYTSAGGVGELVRVPWNAVCQNSKGRPASGTYGIQLKTGAQKITRLFTVK